MSGPAGFRLHRALETAAILLVAGLWLVLAARLLAQAEPGHWWIVATAALLGYLAADLLSGLVHWTFDTWGSERTPLVGRGFIAPFREHHRDPASITRHDFIETNGNNSIGVLPALAAAGFIRGHTPGELFALAFVLFAGAGLVATNQIHKWAHEASPPRPVVWLQRRWLILPAAHHRRHHTAPYATHYCITTGWMNALLAAADFHRRVERAVATLREARRG